MSSPDRFSDFQWPTPAFSPSGSLLFTHTDHSEEDVRRWSPLLLSSPEPSFHSPLPLASPSSHDFTHPILIDPQWPTVVEEAVTTYQPSNSPSTQPLYCATLSFPSNGCLTPGPGPDSSSSSFTAHPLTTSARAVKRSHREIDSDRRAKEAMAMLALEKLTEQHVSKEMNGSPTAPSTRVLPTPKVRKLAVLLASAEEIERLRHLVNHLTTQTNIPNTSNTSRLPLLLQWWSEHHTLNSSLSPYMGLVVIAFDVHTRALLECSSRFYEVTGFFPEEINERRAITSSSASAEREILPTMRWRRPKSQTFLGDSDDFEDVYLPLPTISCFTDYVAPAAEWGGYKRLRDVENSSPGWLGVGKLSASVAGRDEPRNGIGWCCDRHARVWLWTIDSSGSMVTEKLSANCAGGSGIE